MVVEEEAAALKIPSPISVRSLKEEEEEAVFIRGVNTNEDPPNAHQARRRRLSLLVL